ncbi:histone-like nucleoid-structuring protein Lsr2 [Gordonia terrae]|uniref:histone-like nucleoid-structuring protein Lsr2 n=1 Tax=Gordonia terrae TaxID=2055 RepID=UPI003F6B3589
MGRIARVEWVDDLDGKPVDADECQRVEFEVKFPGRRGIRYVLDLRPSNVAKFEKDLGKYLEKAAPVRAASSASGRVLPASATAAERTRFIREWALQNGYEVSTRGRIPQAIIDAFNERQ